MNRFQQLAAIALCAAAAHSQAITVSVTTGATSPVAGALTDTFDAGASIDLSISGGRFFGASIGGVTARPPGSTGLFWSIGITGNQAGPGIVDLDGPAIYYGFLWGSPDTFNIVSFYNQGRLLQSFGGGDVFTSANGFQGSFAAGQYVGFRAEGSQVFDEVRFVSNGNAFETDNHAVLASPIPEPETYALMLAGLGVVGWMARRRRSR